MAVTKFVFGDKERVFESKTIVKLQVADNLYDNILDYKFKVNVQEKNSIGYIVRVEIIDSKQTATDFSSVIFAELGRVNEKIIFQTDQNCNLLEINNKKELLEKWESSVFPELEKKYRDNTKAIEFLNLFEGFLKNSDNNQMETSMKNKGFYDTIFNGLISVDATNKDFVINKNISNFINEIPLPFIVKDYVIEEPVIGNEKQKWIRGTGVLDYEKFDQNYLRQNIRKLTGNAIFPVKPLFEYQEAYRINENNNQFIEARQDLMFFVEGYYYSATKNIIKEIL